MEMEMEEGGVRRTDGDRVRLFLTSVFLLFHRGTALSLSLSSSP